MQLSYKILGWLLLINCLHGCAWLSNEDKLLTMSSLPKVMNQFQPIMVWNYQVGSGTGKVYSTLHPAWHNNCLFVADRNGIVQALDINSKKKKWLTDLSKPTIFRLSSQPAQLSGGVTAMNNHVYIGSELAIVYALNQQNGQLIWKSIVASEVLSTPVVSHGVVLVHTSNGMLQALDENNGTIKWTINLSIPPILTLRGEATPTIVLDRAIVGDDNGRIYAIMIKQGQIIWQQRISQLSDTNKIGLMNDVQSTPIVVNNIIYALSYNGRLVALDLSSGQIIWFKKIGSATNLLVNNQHIYLVDQNNCIMGLDAANGGETLWQQNKLMHRTLTSPVLYNGYIVTGDSQGYLHWINPANGQLVVQHKVDHTGFLAQPIVAGNKLVVQATNGKIYVFLSSQKKC